VRDHLFEDLTQRIASDWLIADLFAEVRVPTYEAVVA